ncbi:MAG: hypothetical protein MRT15_05115 [archaeon YNP-LCB-003-016]|jgi:hypothetical protein|uniref:hypothetical protein n=1 Tax=Candidatus Culexarchaeum yellowstonense TaxID=2928963 RepID=UPI0026EA640A|nr:hypothetical protein [Candidatus Culexarchaeum yellowstonense]MCR6691746.1 hypothetical protein [Candidatus Culexarchaeum yellowstonense]
MSEKKEKTPFRVKMSDGSIETVYAYSEKQALYLASSRSGKKAVGVVGILMEHKEEEGKGEGTVEYVEIIRKLEEAIKSGRYIEAIELKTQIQRMIAEEKLNWNNELEKKYHLFWSWCNVR